MTKPKTTHFDTLSLHAGAKPDPATGARATPIYQSASFVFPDSDHAAALFQQWRAGHVYSRLSNPTCAVLEERIRRARGWRRRDRDGKRAGGTPSCDRHAALLRLEHRRVARALRRLAQSARLHTAAIRRRDDLRRSARHRWLARGDTPHHAPDVGETLGNPGLDVLDIPRVAARCARTRTAAAGRLDVHHALSDAAVRAGCGPRVPFATKFLSGTARLGGLVVDSGRFDWDGHGKYPRRAASSRR